MECAGVIQEERATSWKGLEDLKSVGRTLRSGRWVRAIWHC